MLNELEQSVRCLVGFPRKAVPSHQGEQLTVDQLKQQWASRLQLTQVSARMDAIFPTFVGFPTF